ncbi:MAG: cardiolipin synthase [Methanomethylophilus sp.]|jgi:cardiolipin synthase
MTYALQGHVWDFIYAVFTVIDILIMLALILARRSTVRRQVIWFIVMLINPVIMFAAYIMIGKPVFRRRFRTYRNEGIETIDRYIMARTDMAEPLGAARALARSGALEFTYDSSATYIPGGTQYFGSLFGDLRRAEHLIAVECYVIRRDRTAKEFMDILEERAKAGVRVYVSFDDYGYDGGDMRFVERLKKAGCHLSFFHNMNRTMFSPKKNCRDHRKTVVIDGRIAYQGGYNIGNEYLGDGPFGEWRDAAVRITGPQAKNMLRLFRDLWLYSEREEIDFPELKAEVPASDSPVPMQIIPGDPVAPDDNPVGIEFLTLIGYARSSIYIETPYFTPTRPVLKELLMKAKSGVDVRIVIPDVADHPCVFWANRHYADMAIKAGCKVYEYHGGFLHSKTIVADRFYASVGTANFDERSVKINLECNVLMYSREMGERVADEVLQDISKSTEYTHEMYASRTGWERVKTFFSMLNYDQL